VFKVSWKKYRKLIPNRVPIKRNVWYEILWTTEFLKSDKQLGETRFDTRQILINSNQSDSETLHTVFHEIIHAVSFEYDLGMTETQVSKMENFLYYLIKTIFLFKED
jgi:Zn-dependent peptidase ImmA (M78 family)